MKSIVIITQTLLSGGAEKQSVYLAKILCKKYKVFFIILKGNNVEQKFLNLLKTDSVNFILLKGGILKTTFEVVKILKKESIDITFSYLASGNFVNAVAGIFAGVKNRIGGIRNAELSPKKLPFERFFHNQLLTKSISNSHSAVNRLKNLGFKENKFHVIHNAFDVNQPIINRENSKLINILSVARFVPQKDFFTALKSIALLKDYLNISVYDFHYLLVGYGEQEEQIRNWVKELNVSDKVEIIIKPDNLFEYYKKADIFLTTSLFEGLSNSVMEAMSFSLPVVATPAGDMEYLVKENQNGFLVDAKDYTTISIRLKKLIVNYDLRISMGLNGYSLLKTDFSMEQFKKNYFKFIDNLNE